MAIILAYLIGPRIIALFYLLLTDNFQSLGLPILGIIFMPWTTVWTGFVGGRGGYNSLFRKLILILMIAIDLGVFNLTTDPNETKKTFIEV